MTEKFSQKTNQKRGYKNKGMVGVLNFSNEEIPATQELFYRLFRKNTDIKSAVAKLQSATGGRGFFIEKNSEKITDEKYLRAFKNFRSIKSSMIRDLWVSGNAFLLPIKNPYGDIIDWQTLDPRTITIFLDKYGEVTRYTQRVGANFEHFEPNEIFHLVEMSDPDNEHLGLSRIETLVYDVMGDNEAMKSNYFFFKNNAVPNTIVILEDGIDDEQYEKAIASMKAQFSGGANRHKVSTNIGIKDIRTIGQTYKDMEFTLLRQFTTDKVCSAMSVPKTVLGYHDSVNYSTSDNLYRTFIEETVRPLEDLIGDFISKILQENFGDPNIRFVFVDDRDFDRTAKIDEYIKMLNNGLITIDEVRVEMGYTAFGLDATTKPIIRQGYEFVEDIGTMDLLPENLPPEE
ncbi:MAG: phage portal protein [Candidatus Gracilibacteria bacterium]|nr:phage portal protein [Candidatus Gracilibacteria bacterium]